MSGSKRQEIPTRTKHAVAALLLGSGLVAGWGLYSNLRPRNAPSSRVSSLNPVPSMSAAPTHKPLASQKTFSELTISISNFLSGWDLQAEKYLFNATSRTFLNDVNPMLTRVSAGALNRGAAFAHSMQRLVPDLLYASEVLASKHEDQKKNVELASKLLRNAKIYLEKQEACLQKVEKGMLTYSSSGTHLENIDAWTVEEIDEYVGRVSRNSINVAPIHQSDSEHGRMLILKNEVCNVAIAVGDSQTVWVNSYVDRKHTPKTVTSTEITAGARNPSNCHATHEIYLMRQVLVLLEAAKVRITNNSKVSLTMHAPELNKEFLLTANIHQNEEGMGIDWANITDQNGHHDVFGDFLKHICLLTDLNDWPLATLSLEDGLHITFKVGVVGSVNDIATILQGAAQDTRRDSFSDPPPLEYAPLDTTQGDASRQVRELSNKLRSQLAG